MQEFFTQVLDWLKNSQKQALPIAIASAIILFAPSQFITLIGFDHIDQNIKPYLGVALVFSVALVIASFCEWGATTIRKIVSNWKISRNRTNIFKKLSSDEIKILRSYIESNTKTRYFNIMDGAISGLVCANILYQATDVGYGSGEFAFNIQPWAWDYLNERKEIIGIR